MNTNKWTIGDVEVFQIVEIEAGELIQTVIKGATRENIKTIDWLCPHFADENGNLKALVQSFLIRSNGTNILIDTCNGNDKVRKDVPEWANLQTEFWTKLKAIVPNSDIHVVACTHLHMDHVGWNTKLENGAWVPSFPNAQYLFAKREYEYWSRKPEKEIADDKAAFDDSVMPIMAAGLVKLVEVDHQIDRHVRFVSTPGHTPAHVSVMIESRGKSALISGDALHHPCQIAKPLWATESDTFPDVAVATRQKLLADIADSETLLIGSHFADPVVGRVVRLKDDYRFEVTRPKENR